MVLDRGDLLVDHLVGLAEELAPLAVPDDDVVARSSLARNTGDTSPVNAPLSSQWQCCAPSANAELVGSIDGLHAADVGERRVDADVDVLVVVLADEVVQLLHGLDRLEVVEVHLPVAGDERLAAS